MTLVDKSLPTLIGLAGEASQRGLPGSAQVFSPVSTCALSLTVLDASRDPNEINCVCSHSLHCAPHRQHHPCTHEHDASAKHAELRVRHRPGMLG